MNVVILAASLDQVKIVRIFRILRRMKVSVLSLIVLHRFVLLDVDAVAAEKVLNLLEVLVRDQGKILSKIVTTEEKILIFSKLI